MVFCKCYGWTMHLVTLALGVSIGPYMSGPTHASHLASVSQAVGPSWSTAAPPSENLSLQPYTHYTAIREDNPPGGTDRVAVSGPRFGSPSPLNTVLTDAPLNLRLIGTVVGDAEHTLAFIEDLNAQRQWLYRIGDIVQGAKIMEIGRNRVVLDHHGRREELLNRQSMETSSPSPEAVPGPTLQPPSEETEVREQADVEEAGPMDIRQVRDHEWSISREELSKQFENLHQLLREARLIPYFRDHQAAGFTVTRLVRKSFLEQIGLRNGDILMGINGQKLNTLEEALQAYQSLQSGPVLHLEIERNQHKEIFRYEIR